MSGTRRTFHPGFLRKMAVISILGGLAIGAALFGLRLIPMMVGASEWAGVEPRFVPLVDGLFVVGLLAHLAAMFIVVRDRNPGLAHFVRRSFERRATPMQVAPGTGAEHDAVGVTEGEFISDELTGEPRVDLDEPTLATSQRLRSAWSQLRATMRTRRGTPTPPPAAGDGSDTGAIRLLGSTPDADGDTEGLLESIPERDDDGR